MPSKGTPQPDDIIEDDLSRWPQLDIGEPPSELVEYAKNEIGEFAETRLQFCSELRDMIYERGECTPHRYDDLFLMRFLRARNFVVRRAHRLMVNYYRLREELSIDGEDKEDRSPMLELAQTLGEQDVISIPPHVDRTGRRLMVFRPGRWRPDECGVDELLRATLACMEIGVLEPRAQILGGICIFDLEGLRLEHAMQVTPYVAQRVVELMTTSFPMRVHAVHVVRAPWPFRLAWRAFKPLVDNEKRKRLHLHGSDFGQLHEHVGRDCLPVSLGGRRPDVNYKLWLIAMHENEKILNEMRSLGYRLHQHHIDELIKNNQHLIPSKPVTSHKIKTSSTDNVEEENAIVVL